MLEMRFPPFFDIMIHLLVHIVHEIKIPWSCILHHMWTFERSMAILKKDPGAERENDKTTKEEVYGVPKNIKPQICSPPLADSREPVMDI